MRIVPLAMLAAVTLLAADPARAQTYDPNFPVCLQVWGQGITTYYECRYSSLAQCNVSASGRAAHCMVNPYYANARDDRPARGHKHRRAH